MKKNLLFLSLCFIVTSMSYAQSTYSKVYEIFQSKCVSCHSNASPQGQLDLQGSGTTAAATVFSKLVKTKPKNAIAAAKGDFLIYPGRADRSFLFRKCNDTFEKTITLASNEGTAMPKSGTALTDKEKEIIRQWILYGASQTAKSLDLTLIDTYYDKGGKSSFPDGAPPAPAVGEGFQIKMGPFFLKPDGEIEYYQKYELTLPTDVEVNRVDFKISSYSHHFILYNFGQGGDASIPAGLRLNANHSNISLVAAVQESTDLKLPKNTAFKWKNNLVLDLNSHCINYSLDQVFAAEAYVNVYTQKTGTAKQEMYTNLIPNLNISIPNNGNLTTFSKSVVLANTPPVYLWGLMGHTHKYGKSYKIFARQNNGQKGELLYDAACPQGTPNCVSPWYDYKHIPMRYFSPLQKTVVNNNGGFVHEASWMNDGPVPVAFGPTSDDEMMVMIAMYTLDTIGLSTPTRDLEKNSLDNVRVSPNPMLDAATFTLPIDAENVDFTLFDVTGKVIFQQKNIQEKEFVLERNNLMQGIYLYQLEDAQGRRSVGRLVVE